MWRPQRVGPHYAGVLGLVARGMKVDDSCLGDVERLSEGSRSGEVTWRRGDQ